MLSKNLALYFFSLLAILTIGCSKNQIFPNDAAMWEFLKNEKNGYSQQKTINGVNYQLVYKPTDLLVQQELRGKKASDRVIDSLRKKYDPYIYFNLSMSKNDKELLSNVAGNRQQFGAMVNTLAFGMEDKIHLFTEKRDTIPMLDYIYPRMYGMTRNTSIMLVYLKKEISKSSKINLSINDIGFSTGEVSFTQNTELIKVQPSINFKNF